MFLYLRYDLAENEETNYRKKNRLLRVKTKGVNSLEVVVVVYKAAELSYKRQSRTC